MNKLLLLKLLLLNKLYYFDNDEVCVKKLKKGGDINNLKFNSDIKNNSEENIIKFNLYLNQFNSDDYYYSEIIKFFNNNNISEIYKYYYIKEKCYCDIDLIILK